MFLLFTVDTRGAGWLGELVCRLVRAVLSEEKDASMPPKWGRVAPGGWHRVGSRQTAVGARLVLSMMSVEGNPLRSCAASVINKMGGTGPVERADMQERGQRGASVKA